MSMDDKGRLRVPAELQEDVDQLINKPGNELVIFLEQIRLALRRPLSNSQLEGLSADELRILEQLKAGRLKKGILFSKNDSAGVERALREESGRFSTQNLSSFQANTHVRILESQRRISIPDEFRLPNDVLPHETEFVFATSSLHHVIELWHAKVLDCVNTLALRDIQIDTRTEIDQALAKTFPLTRRRAS